MAELFYYASGQKVTIDPPADEVAIALTHDAPPGSGDFLFDELTGGMPDGTVKPLHQDEHDSLKGLSPDGLIVLKFRNVQDRSSQAAVMESFRKAIQQDPALAQHRHARVAVRLRAEGPLTLMSDRFVVRRTRRITASDFEALLAAGNAVRLRRLGHPQTWLIRFKDADYERHLGQIEQWRKRGLILYGHPDLLFRLSHGQGNTADVEPIDGTAALTVEQPASEIFPNDPQLDWSESGFFVRHRIGEAWDYLLDLGLSPFGDGLNIGIFDSWLPGHVEDGHFVVKHEDVDNTGPRVYRNSAGTSLDQDTHGLSVFGLIAAVAHNGRCAAGIAHRTTQVFVAHNVSLLAEASGYTTVLRWLAGLPVDTEMAPLSDGSALPFVTTPNPHPVEIICCAHERGYGPDPLEDLFNETFIALAQDGSSGRGTLLCYAAGNTNATVLASANLWPLHDRTLAIGCLDSGDHAVGAYGTAVDCYTRGQNAPTLHPDGTTTLTSFGGTSAAAPIACGVLALMRTVNPDLTLDQAREIFRVQALRETTGSYAPLDARLAVEAAHELTAGWFDTLVAAAETAAGYIVRILRPESQA